MNIPFDLPPPLLHPELHLCSRLATLLKMAKNLGLCGGGGRTDGPREPLERREREKALEVEHESRARRPSHERRRHEADDDGEALVDEG